MPNGIEASRHEINDFHSSGPGIFVGTVGAVRDTLMWMERHSTPYPSAFIVNTSLQMLKDGEVNGYSTNAYRCEEITMPIADKEFDIPRTQKAILMNIGDGDIRFNPPKIAAARTKLE